MEWIFVLLVGGTVLYFVFRVLVVAKNVTTKVVGTAREINTRLSDSITCGSCKTALPTVIQAPCLGCGYTKTRNIASACPNCGRKAGFADCPNCGESVKFA